MPIKCTYRDLDKLRDTPNRKSPLGKLAEAESLSIVDKFRVARLLKAVDAELVIYGRALIELGKKYGDPVKINGTDSYQIRADDNAAYLASKTDLDGDACEVAANPLPASAYEIPVLTALDLSLLEPFIVLPPADDSSK